ncbi:oligosaccharide flippase family protein [Halomonas sp. 18H]|nr:oligosaccharide flippase family protein [Halomonas sp. 18H]MCW4152614.1 oligosaccharide flippase family protein [Halomonas sp. 18H]
MKSINSIKKFLPQNTFARGVSVLVGGTAGAQLIVIAASPVLTRLYTPEDFGLLAVYAGILGILGAIASLRYQLAIPLPESDEEAASIAMLSLIMVVSTTLCSAVGVWLWGNQLVSLLNTPNLAPYLWLIPLGLFLVGFYQVFQYWAIRTKLFSSIAKTKLTQSVGMVIIQVVGFTLGPIALLLGRVVGQCAGAFGLAKSAFKINSSSFKSVNKDGVKDAAIKYKKFPFVSTWAGLASSAGSQLPPLIIASVLGINSAGLFSLAQRVLSQPMSVIGKAISDVFYQRASQAFREGGLDFIVLKVFSTLLVLAITPAIIFFIYAPEIFRVVFGEEWYSAGIIARWMVPWMLADFIVSPCTGIYPIINKHGTALGFQVSLMLSGVFGTLVGGWHYGSLTAVVVIMSLTNAFIYVYRLFNIFFILRLSLKSLVRQIIVCAVLSLLISFPVVVSWLMFYGNLLAMLSALFVSIAMWAFYVAKNLRMIIK